MSGDTAVTIEFAYAAAELVRQRAADATDATITRHEVVGVHGVMLGQAIPGPCRGCCVSCPPRRAELLGGGLHQISDPLHGLGGADDFRGSEKRTWAPYPLQLVAAEPQVHLATALAGNDWCWRREVRVHARRRAVEDRFDRCLNVVVGVGRHGVEIDLGSLDSVPRHLVWRATLPELRIGAE